MLPVPLGAGTVLLVENDVLVRNVAAQSLALAGYEVLESGNGNVALAIARTYEDKIDLLITFRRGFKKLSSLVEHHSCGICVMLDCLEDKTSEASRSRRFNSRHFRSRQGPRALSSRD